MRVLVSLLLLLPAAALAQSSAQTAAARCMVGVDQVGPDTALEHRQRLLDTCLGVFTKQGCRDAQRHRAIAPAPPRGTPRSYDSVLAACRQDYCASLTGKTPEVQQACGGGGPAPAPGEAAPTQLDLLDTLESAIFRHETQQKDVEAFTRAWTRARSAMTLPPPREKQPALRLERDGAKQLARAELGGETIAGPVELAAREGDPALRQLLETLNEKTPKEIRLIEITGTRVVQFKFVRWAMAAATQAGFDEVAFAIQDEAQPLPKPPSLTEPLPKP